MILLARPYFSLRSLLAGIIVFVWFGWAFPVTQPAAQGQSPEIHNVDLASAEDLKANWTGFRGFGSNAQAEYATPPLTWSADDVVWKSPIPKQGMSSPIVWKTKLFLTGADEQSRDIYCFGTLTGELIWKHSVNRLPDSPADGQLPEVMEEAGLAAPTAATNGQFVAAIFATGELVCVDMEGRRVWAKHLGTPDNPYGHASSLICNRELLFVQFDQRGEAKLFAFEMATGKPVWQVARKEISWSSPILIDNGGRDELILADNKAVSSYDPKTGNRYWRVECLNGDVAPSPAYSDGQVFVAVEYSSASAIDISNHAAEPRIVWQWDEALPDAASSVVNQDYVILPTAFGVVTCLDAKTGSVCWEHEFDRGFSSSPIVAKDRVYLADLSGNMQVFKMSREFVLLGTSALGEAVYATPAFVGERIFVRGLTHVYCIGSMQK